MGSVTCPEGYSKLLEPSKPVPLWGDLGQGDGVRRVCFQPWASAQDARCRGRVCYYPRSPRAASGISSPVTYYRRTESVTRAASSILAAGYAGIRQILPGSQSRRCPKPIGEANGCDLGHLTPKTLQKALYVGLSQISQPLQVVCFCWSQFPFPEAPPSKGRQDQSTADALRLWRSPPPCGSPMV